MMLNESNFWRKFPIAIVMAFLTTASAIAELQPMRLAPGKYAVGKPIYAHCINVEAETPPGGAPFNFGSAGITVTRHVAGSPDETMQLGQAVGHWISISGADEFYKLNTNAIDTTASFTIDVTEDSDGVFAATPDDLRGAEKWVEGSRDAVRRLDRFEQNLGVIFGVDNGVLNDFRGQKADAEWSWKDGPDTAGLAVDNLIAEFPVSLGKTAQARLQRLSLLNGQPLTPEKIAATDQLLGVSIARSLPEAEAAGWREFNARQDRLAACFGRDNEVTQDYISNALKDAQMLSSMAGALSGDQDAPPLPEFATDLMSLELGLPMTVERREAYAMAFGVGLPQPTGILERYVMLMPDGMGWRVSTTRGIKTISRDAANNPDLIRQMLLNPGLQVVLAGEDADIQKMGQTLMAAGIEFQSMDDFIADLERGDYHMKTIDGGSGVDLRHNDAIPGEEAQLDLLDLPGNGACATLRAEDGSLVVIDLGDSENAGKMIRDHLSVMAAGEKIRVRLLITHLDFDHIGGLTALIQDPRIEIHEIVLSHHRADSTKAKNVVMFFKNNGFIQVPEESSGLLSHFVRNLDSAIVKTLPAAPDFTVHTASLGGVDVQIAQWTDPNASRNNASLVVKVIHKGRSALLTADLQEPAMRAFVNAEHQFGGSFTLMSDFMTHPHHVSFPDSTSFRNALGAFVDCVQPRIVALSGWGANQTPAHLDASVGFYILRFGSWVRTISTRNNGSIRIITLDFSRPLTNPRAVPLIEWNRLKRAEA